MITNLVVSIVTFLSTNTVERLPASSQYEQFLPTGRIYSGQIEMGWQNTATEKWISTNVWSVTVRTELGGKVLDATSNLVSSVEQHYKQKFEFVKEGEPVDIKDTVLFGNDRVKMLSSSNFPSMFITTNYYNYDLSN